MNAYLQRKKLFLLIIRFLISAGILYYLYLKIDIYELFSIYSRMGLLILIVPVGLLGCQYALSTLKWYFILNFDGVKASYLFLARSYLIGHFISLFLPTSFGGDIYRVYVLKRYSLSMPKNASSVIFDRLTGLYALTTISLFSYFMFYEDSINFRFLFYYIVPIILFLLLSSNFIISRLNKFQNKLIYILITILQSFQKYRKNKLLMFKAIFISFIFQFNIVMIVKCYCIALGIDIGIERLAMFVPIVLLMEAIPISINGLGIREVAFAFFFKALGHSGEEAISLSLLIISMRLILSSIIGGILLHFTDEKVGIQKKNPKGILI